MATLDRDPRHCVQLAEGISRFSVPLPTRNPSYLFVYAIEGDDGLYVIDTGWHDADSYDAFVLGLKTFGCELSDVRGILVTHFHPDHFGLAARLREESGAWIGVHPADAAAAARNRDEFAQVGSDHIAVLRRAGAPTPVIDHVARRWGASPWQGWLVDPDVLLQDGDKAMVPGRELEVIWTPGHSPGHVCFAEASAGVLFSGDHVLPRMMPILPFGPPGLDHAYDDYVHSLDRISERGFASAHPAHEDAIDDLPSRIESLQAHYRGRLRQVLDAIDEKQLTAWQITESLAWPRPWAEMRDSRRRIVLGETMSYLTHLTADGQLVEHLGEPSRFERVQ